MVRKSCFLTYVEPSCACEFPSLLQLSIVVSSDSAPCPREGQGFHSSQHLLFLAQSSWYFVSTVCWLYSCTTVFKQFSNLASHTAFKQVTLPVPMLIMKYPSIHIFQHWTTYSLLCHRNSKDHIFICGEYPHHHPGNACLIPTIVDDVLSQISFPS